MWIRYVYISYRQIEAPEDKINVCRRIYNKTVDQKFDDRNDIRVRLDKTHFKLMLLTEVNDVRDNWII